MPRFQGQTSWQMSQPYTWAPRCSSNAAGIGVGGLRPVREALGRVERARLVEGAGRARLDAEGAGAAVELEPRRRLHGHVRDERAEDDPGPVAVRDQHRVLAVEADAGAGRALPVDVLVRVDQHAVAAAEAPAEQVEPLAQHGVGVVPGVAREPALPHARLGPGRVVAERRRDDRPRARQQRLRVTRHLGLRHREAHVGEEAAFPALTNVALGLLVGLRRSRADDVDPELLARAARARPRSHSCPFQTCPLRLGPAAGLPPVSR